MVIIPVEHSLGCFSNEQCHSMYAVLTHTAYKMITTTETICTALLMPLGIICSTRLLGFLSDSLQIKVVMGQLRLMKYIMHFKCNLDWSLCSCAVYDYFFFYALQT